MHKNFKLYALAFLLMIPLVFLSKKISAQQNQIKIIDLRGYWKFSIGERKEWIEPGYNDNDWESIKVPSSWEDQGFQGYNGFAFYRNTFTISEKHKDDALCLHLGYIDDVDETYFNGHKIGSTGSFPHSFQTAYTAKRIYYIPSEIINFNGNNTLVVKVYDNYRYGGIISGNIGVFCDKNSIPVDINLQGEWNFHIHDNMNWKEVSYNDSDWAKIMVPGNWEDQQYRDYDGYAWYRKSFVYNKQFTDDKIVILAGKIDDIDQVYINGELVGSTGEFQGKQEQTRISSYEYIALRGYYFSEKLLKKNERNVIAIRVYDHGGGGGIYEGPLGIISQKKYIEFWRNRKNKY